MKKYKHPLVGQLIRIIPPKARNMIRHVPGLSHLQRIFLKLFAPKQEFAHEIDWGPAAGLKYLVRLPQDKEMWKGTYELGFCNLLQRSVQKGDVCYDIGAFRGYTTGVFALAGAGQVFAFEPMPENQTTIQTLIEMNPDLPIVLIPQAVADEEGIATLEINQDPSMNRLGSVTGKQGVKRVDVRTTSVDITAHQTGKYPTILKIDVEGAEVAVLQGAVKALRENLRSVFLEIHNSEAEKECLKILTNEGFSCAWKEREWGIFANQAMFIKK